MSATTALVTVAPAGPTRNWSMVSAVAYVASWVAGLTAFGTGPGAGASTPEVVEYFANHRVATTIQSLLVHGLAAAALLVVLVSVRRTTTLSRTAFGAGVVGVALSLIQLVLDVWRSLIATGSTISLLVDVIDRVDGVKMFAFAVMIGASISGLRSAGMIGRRMASVGIAATAALVVSGVAYAGAVEALLASAVLSLPLLLVWVGYLGVTAGRRRA